MHTNFEEECEFLASDWSKFKSHQSNSNYSANSRPKFAKPKSVLYSSCSGYSDIYNIMFTKQRYGAHSCRIYLQEIIHAIIFHTHPVLVFVVISFEREVIRFILIVYSSKDFVLKRGVNFPEEPTRLDTTKQKEGSKGHVHSKISTVCAMQCVLLTRFLKLIQHMS